MVSVCFYFQVHQPVRMRHYSVFDIGSNSNYFDSRKNREIIKKIGRKCYLPANKVILELIKSHNENFRISYSITGVALDQFEQYFPEVIDSFQKLADTGCVEFLSETYHHTLAYLYSKPEFFNQVRLHKRKIKSLFGKNPTVFRNTELIYSNALAKDIEGMGFKGITAEGAKNVLGQRSPNFIYTPARCKNIKILLKNYRLSDDIAFRFSNKSWKEYPLTPEKFAGWVNKANGSVVNLFLDYETFGEHQWASTGIFKFLKAVPKKILRDNNNFMTPSEVIKAYEPSGRIDVRNPVSWADAERDLSAWTGNQMQQYALSKLYNIEKKIISTKNKKLIDDWRKLQISDHFYYMCTKWFSDGDVHKYFNPYDSPYDSFIIFMNILNDIKLRTKNKKIYKQK